MVAGSRLHGPGTIRVASSKGFGNRCTGLSTCIACPTQNELQCRSLRKGLKWWQPLWENQTTVSGCTRIQDTGQAEIHTKPSTFPSRMVSHVARFLLTGLSSIPCIDTSYSPSSSCNLLWITTAWNLTCTEGKRSSNLQKTHTCSYQRPSSAQHKSL